jgi:hypothetical protein
MKALILLPIALSASALAESAIPSAFLRDRYQATYLASPFALATPPPAPEAPPEPDDFANLVVTGLGKLDDGRTFVVIRRNGEETSMRFEGSDAGSDGYSVKKVMLADRWGDSAVVLAKGGKDGRVKFNENASAIAPAPPKSAGSRPPIRTTSTIPTKGGPVITGPSSHGRPPHSGGNVKIAR